MKEIVAPLMPVESKVDDGLAQKKEASLVKRSNSDEIEETFEKPAEPKHKMSDLEQMVKSLDAKLTPSKFESFEPK